MKRKIILFGTFLSIFILVLVPNVGCINATIQKEELSYIKNIEIDDIKKIERILNTDCNCQKAVNYDNSESWSPFFLCKILGVIFYIVLCLAINTSYYSIIITRILVSIMEIMIGLGIILNCDWSFLFPLNEEFYE